MEKRAQYGLIILAIAVVAVIAIGFAFIGDEEMTNVEMLEAGELEVVSEQANYYSDFNGYLAKPESEGSYPGIIMIHEWWGLNDNIRQMADNLASEGYIVLAVDLYGEVANDTNKARELSSAVRADPEEALENMRAAREYLEQQGATRLATLGWCFGGGQSLQFSLNESVDATVIYYGNLVTNESELAKLDSPVLGIFGSNDTSIPVSTVEEFDNTLDELGVENEIYVYEGVGHAFANPSGANYAAAETMDAWEKTVAFLEENLK